MSRYTQKSAILAKNFRADEDVALPPPLPLPPPSRFAEQEVSRTRRRKRKRRTTLSAFGPRYTRLCSCPLLASLLLACSLAAEEKTTYQDHVLPLIEANCSKCHNTDKKKADLDLTSFQGALKGSGSGTVLVSGNLDGSKLWKALTHAEEPFMPPNRPKLGDKELDIFKKWIADGLLENAGAKAIAASKPALDLTLKPEALNKP